MRRSLLVVLAAAVVAAIWSCPPARISEPGDAGSTRPPDAAVPETDAGEVPLEDGGTAPPWGLDERPKNPTCIAPQRPIEDTGVAVQRAFSALTFNLPVLLLQAPGDASRVFVVQKRGVVKVFDNQPGVTTTADFIDITSRVNSSPNEAGLLGMAFHPRFATNGQVFLSYTGYGVSTTLRTVISRFTSNDSGKTLDPASEQILLTQDQPYNNHNGGHIAFGPDGYLYIGLGDGGSGGDPQRHAQNVNSLLGKMLRIDVDGAAPYAIPPSNPFAGGGGRPEIYALGLRNPWRWSFDRGTGELWAGDVGQNAIEEVDRIVLGGNYGWNIREGSRCYGAATCTSAGLIGPVAEYPHSDGVSITGGYVYRGTAIPSLVGKYVYADFDSGRIWALFPDEVDGRTLQPKLLVDTALQISSFGETEDGGLYVLHYGGTLHKLVPSAPPTTSTFPEKLSATGCVNPQDPTRPAPGLIPFDVNAPLWSDGAEKERFLALPDGTQIEVNPDGDWTFPSGTVLMKTFFLGGKRVETRLFMRHPDGVWAGYSYEWNDAQTDAVLLPGSKAKSLGSQTWYFPSRTECMQCHTPAAGFALGPETAQLNRDLLYPTGRRRNQLTTFEHVGLFTAPLGQSPSSLPRLPPLDGPEPLEPRARAYLHANCSGCHRPGGVTQASFDVRYATPLADANLCDMAPQQGTLGIGGARLLAPGSPSTSLLSVRMHALNAYRMPPVASRIVDPSGTGLVDGWISSLSDCP